MPCVDRNKLKDLKNAIAGLAVILVVVSLNKQSDRSVVCFAPRPFIERLMEKPANHRHTKLDGLPKDSVKSRELISTNSLLQLHTKTQSGYSSRLSTISTLNAIRSISKRLSSMATLMRQSTLYHQKAAIYRQTKSYICGNLFMVSSNRHAVSTKHLTSGCEVKGLLQLEPIPAFIPDDKAIHS